MFSGSPPFWSLFSEAFHCSTSFFDVLSTASLVGSVSLSTSPPSLFLSILCCISFINGSSASNFDDSFDIDMHPDEFKVGSLAARSPWSYAVIIPCPILIITSLIVSVLCICTWTYAPFFIALMDKEPNLRAVSSRAVSRRNHSFTSITLFASSTFMTLLTAPFWPHRHPLFECVCHWYGITLHRLLQLLYRCFVILWAISTDRTDTPTFSFTTYYSDSVDRAFFLDIGSQMELPPSCLYLLQAAFIVCIVKMDYFCLFDCIWTQRVIRVQFWRVILLLYSLIDAFYYMMNETVLPYDADYWQSYSDIERDGVLFNLIISNNMLRFELESYDNENGREPKIIRSTPWDC